MNFLHGRQFIRALIDAGIVPDETVSVVIEANAKNVVTIYVQQFGDQRLLNVTQTLQGAVISRDDPQDTQKPGDQTCS